MLILEYHINLMVFSICFVLSFQFFFHLFCISLVFLTFRHSAQILVEKCFNLPAECSPPKSLTLFEILAAEFIQAYPEVRYHDQEAVYREEDSFNCNLFRVVLT